jgi:hypothetical protein
MSTSTPGFTEELQMRVFWREWDRLVNGQQHPLEVPLYNIADEHVSIRRRHGADAHVG